MGSVTIQSRLTLDIHALGLNIPAFPCVLIECESVGADAGGLLVGRIAEWRVGEDIGGVGLRFDVGDNLGVEEGKEGDKDGLLVDGLWAELDGEVGS